HCRGLRQARRQAQRIRRSRMSRRPAAPLVDVIIAAPAWRRELPRASALVRRAAIAALEAGAPLRLRKRLATSEPAVVLTGDGAIRRLNATYRGKDKPTNVLSFPTYVSLDQLGSEPAILGDVVLAYGTTVREAKTGAKSLQNHVSHLVIHGVLHLLGYDHE